MKRGQNPTVKVDLLSGGENFGARVGAELEFGKGLNFRIGGNAATK
jgi:hypothetical protein